MSTVREKIDETERKRESEKREGKRAEEQRKEQGKNERVEGDREGAESTSDRDKSTRKSERYVRVSVIKGRDMRRGKRERDKKCTVDQAEGNDVMEGTECGGR